jgi:hypothetical protein
MTGCDHMALEINRRGERLTQARLQDSTSPHRGRQNLAQGVASEASGSLGT